MKYLLLILLFSMNVQSRIIIDFSNNFTSYSEKVGGNSDNKYKNMINRFALSSSLDNSGQYHFGYNVELLSRTFGKDKLTLTNMGPKIDSFFGSFFLSGAWHPYSKGERVISGAKESISGWAFSTSLGYIKRITKAFSVGASVTYNSISITKKTNSSNVSSKVKESYSFIYPMLEFKLAFR